jgi:hypothetical protein
MLTTNGVVGVYGIAAAQAANVVYFRVPYCAVCSDVYVYPSGATA